MTKQFYGGVLSPSTNLPSSLLPLELFSARMECSLASRLEDTLTSFVCSYPANIRLGQDVLKTSWRRLQCNIFLSSKTSWRHNCKTSCKHVLKTSWRPLEDVLGKRIANTSWRRLQDVFKTSWKTKSVTLKMSSRRLEDVLENKKCLLGKCYRQLIVSLMMGHTFIVSAARRLIEYVRSNGYIMHVLLRFWFVQWPRFLNQT